MCFSNSRLLLCEICAKDVNEEKTDKFAYPDGQTGRHN